MEKEGVTESRAFFVISDEDEAFRKRKEDLETVRDELQGLLGSDGQKLLKKYQELQEDMACYLLKRGIQIGLESVTALEGAEQFPMSPLYH